MLALIGREGIFSTYSIHDISHVDSMLAMLDWLIPESTRKILSPADWLLVVISIYLHDLGMLVTSEEFEQREKNQEFSEWRKGLETSGDGRDYVARTRRMTEEERQRFFFQEYVRKGHAARIREWITGRHSRRWGKPVQVIASAIEELLRPLPSRFREYLGCVCESHHEDNLHLLNIYPLAGHLGNHPLEIVNVQYAAVLLRSADLLHVTKDRTPSVMYRAIRFSDPKSVAEWDKQLGTFGVRPKGRRLIEGDPESAVVVISADFAEENPFFALQEYVAYADQQVKQSKRWIDQSRESADGKDFSFPWNRVEADVRLEGVPPVPLKFELDRGRLLDLLVGHTIYNEPMVCVRELLQNSIDAVRYQYYLDARSLHSEPKSPPEMGRVRVTWNSAERVLVVEDTGTGMNRDAIDYHLMRVGSSFYDSAQFRAQHHDFSPISRFGIGILTCFMVSDDIEITTCRDSKGHRLRMTSVHASYALRELPAGDVRLAGIEPHGTRITLRLRDSVDLSERSIEDIVRHWIILPECRVEYVEGRSAPLSIGFPSVGEAVEHFYRMGTPSLDSESRSEVVVKDLCETIEFEGCRSQARYELGFVVLSGRFPERVFATAGPKPFPMVCIEGIRVADSLPGFGDEKTRIAALLSVRGSRRFRTTVSRSGLEHDEEFDRVARVCADLLFQHVGDEVARIAAAPGRPLSQAATGARWLTNQLWRNAQVDIAKYLWRAFNDLPSVVIETAGGGKGSRLLLSHTQVKSVPEFWTLDARLVDLLGTISRDIGRELSLAEFVSTLAPGLKHCEFSPLIPDAGMFGIRFWDEHHPLSTEFSREHQYSAIRWVHGADDPSVLVIDLEAICDAVYFEAVRGVYGKSSFARRTTSIHRTLSVFATSVTGDSEKVDVVVAGVGTVLVPGSLAHQFWLRLRQEITALAQASENPEMLIETFAVADALTKWIVGTKSEYPPPEEGWHEVWAAVSDDTRAGLDVPRSPSEIVARAAIFEARNYWRDWKMLREG